MLKTKLYCGIISIVLGTLLISSVIILFIFLNIKYTQSLCRINNAYIHNDHSVTWYIYDIQNHRRAKIYCEDVDKCEEYTEYNIGWTYFCLYDKYNNYKWGDKELFIGIFIILFVVVGFFSINLFIFGIIQLCQYRNLLNNIVDLKLPLVVNIEEENL